MLSRAENLKIEDIIALAMPLAAEQIKEEKVWKMFAKIALEKEHEVPAPEYFSTYANLAWCFAKVDCCEASFWNFIQNMFSNEIKRMEQDQLELHQQATILSTTCFALKDCQGHLLEDTFWK